MKKTKKIVSYLLIVVISMCCVNFQASARVYTDTNGHWAQTYIDFLTENGVMESSSTTYFYPGNIFTRQEAAKSACMLYKQPSYASSPHPFTDVPTSSAYSKYIKYMYDNGIISGTSATTFSPTSGIKRQDLCVILYNLYFNHMSIPYTVVFDKVMYSDDSSISAYAKDEVYLLQRIGVVTNNGGAFRPHDYTTRAEAATMIYLLGQYSAKLDILEEVQSRDDWCWAASTKIIAEYRYPGSRTQNAIGSHFNYIGGATRGELRLAADYATYNNITHSSGLIKSCSTLMDEIAHYRPVVILIGMRNSNDEWINGHYLVVMGYRNRYLGNNQVEFLTYDVLDDSSIQRYNWITYSQLLSGAHPHLNGRKYTETVYSLN